MESELNLPVLLKSEWTLMVMCMKKFQGQSSMISCPKFLKKLGRIVYLYLYYKKLRKTPVL